MGFGGSLVCMLVVGEGVLNAADVAEEVMEFGTFGRGDLDWTVVGFDAEDERVGEGFGGEIAAAGVVVAVDGGTSSAVPDLVEEALG